MTVFLADDLLAFMYNEVLAIIGPDEEHVRVRKPTHGPCCTCQTCGLPYDECQEGEFEERNEFRAKLRQVAAQRYGQIRSEK